MCAHKGNLPDPGKAQDFVKKLAQVLDDDERIRDQLETLVSPSCSCKQAEVCVVSVATATRMLAHWCFILG